MEIRRQLQKLTLLISGAVTCAALAMSPPAQAQVTPFSATLNNGNFSDFSQTNVEQGHLNVTDAMPYEGGPSAEASYEGEGRNGYSRGIFNVQWQEGESVSYAAAYYLPEGFIDNVQGEVDLMRWDNWLAHPEDTDWGGIAIYGSDHRARLLRFGADHPSETLVGPFTLPEGRWFTIEVRQRFSAGAGAFNEVRLDGRLIGRSDDPNMYGRTIERIRYGIVAIAEGVQHKPLNLWFDQAEVRPDGGEPTGVGPAQSLGSGARAATASQAGHALGIAEARPAR